MVIHPLSVQTDIEQIFCKENLVIVSRFFLQSVAAIREHH
jgi:hypothetical protein